MTDQRARALWKSITDEMLLAKRSDMNQRDLAVFTDHRAVTLLRTALADAERRVWEEAAKIAEGFALAYPPADYIRDADTCFDIAAKIRARATLEEAKDDSN